MKFRPIYKDRHTCMYDVCKYEFTGLCDDPLPKQTSHSAVYLAYAFQFGRDQQW